MALKRFLAGSYEVEERMLIEVSVEGRNVEPGPHLALNEAVIEKTPMGHTVRLGVSRGVQLCFRFREGCAR
jgi:NAD kinase